MSRWAACRPALCAAATSSGTSSLTPCREPAILEMLHREGAHLVQGFGIRKPEPLDLLFKP